MISRRLLRIKNMHIVYAWLRNPEGSIEQYHKELQKSITSFEDLYYTFFQLLIEIHHYLLQEIERKKAKHLPTEEELNPNMRFIENPAMQAIVNDEQIQSYVRNNHITWNDNTDLVKKLAHEIEESNFYNRYMVREEEPDHKAHKEVIITILTDIIAASESVFEALEEKSVYWNDDIELVLSMNIRTVERIKRTYRLKPMKLFKNEADQEFVYALFRKTTAHFKDHQEIIKKTASNWELDRIALMDKVIIALGITELRNFPEIPVRVTLNEYIEMAKFYSTEKSNTFVNGVLDKIVLQLKNNNELNKIDGSIFDKDKNNH
ncbi:transcription antitermination factor NusB [Salinivirga cyanobacteriivorans]